MEESLKDMKNMRAKNKNHKRKFGGRVSSKLLIGVFKRNSRIGYKDSTFGYNYNHVS